MAELFHCNNEQVLARNKERLEEQKRFMKFPLDVHEEKRFSEKRKQFIREASQRGQVKNEISNYRKLIFSII